jgi:PAS domain S-box-containing protein
MQEEALQEPATCFCSVIDSVEDYAICMLDPNGCIISCNLGAERMQGYRASEIIGQHFSRFYLSEDLQRGKPAQALEVAVAMGWFEDEGWRVCKDGSQFWAHVFTTALRDEAGQLHGFAQVTRDITERQRAGDALRESEARYRAVVEQSSEGIFLVDAETKCVFEANAAYQHLLGYTAEELLALTLYDVVAHDRASIDHYVQRILWEQRYFMGEQYHRRKDGSVVAVEASGNTVSYGGRAVLCIVVRDITARKQAEEEREQLLAQLKAERARLKAVLQQMPAGVIIADTTSGRTLTYNRQAEHLLGLVNDQPQRSNLESFSSPKTGGLLQQALAGEQFSGIEITVQPAHGAPVPVIASAAPIRTADEHIVGAVGVFQDCQPFKEVKVLREIDRLKSEFIANVSHELRTPLHHIKGYATTLLRPQIHFDAQTMHDYLRTIVDESDKLERLIADLLDTSCIETGTLTLDIESARIDELIRKVVQRWQAIGTHRFEAILPPNLPPVPADVRRIEQVLDNLLVNIVKHTPEHTRAVIEIHFTREELIVSIRDHGPGVAIEHLSRLFDRFYQVSAQSYRRRSGNGLGLFICKGIVEQHGGRIWAELTSGSGLTFRFTLPRRRKVART